MTRPVQIDFARLSCFLSYNSKQLDQTWLLGDEMHRYALVPLAYLFYLMNHSECKCHITLRKNKLLVTFNAISLCPIMKPLQYM